MVATTQMPDVWKHSFMTVDKLILDAKKLMCILGAVNNVSDDMLLHVEQKHQIVNLL